MIESRAPSAAPLVAVDSVAVERAGDCLHVTAMRAIDVSDPHLEAHFPDFKIFPGVFVMEALRQAIDEAIGEGRSIRVTGVQSVRFLAPLYPGDAMRLDAVVAARDGGFQVEARSTRRDKTVVAHLKIRCARVGAEIVDDRIGAVLPHGHPMCLVDQIVALEPGISIVAIKAVTRTEPCYRSVPLGAAREHWAYPESLALESFGQAAAVLWLERGGVQNDHVLMLTAMRDVHIMGAAYPGDVLQHTVRIGNVVGDTVIVEGETCIDGRRVVMVGSMIAVVRARAHMTAKDALERRPCDVVHTNSGG